MPDDNDDNDNSRDDLSDRNAENQNLNPLMENHLSKMRGYLDKQISTIHLNGTEDGLLHSFLKTTTIMM